MKEDKDDLSYLTKEASSVGRQIAIALGAVSWGLFYNSEDKTSDFNWISVVCLLLIILYFTFDILQYYIYAVQLRNPIIKDINKKLDSLTDEERTKPDSGNGEFLIESIKTKLKNERRSFFFFNVKFAFIPIILILLIVYFITKM